MVNKPYSNGKPHMCEYIWIVQTGVHAFKGHKDECVGKGSRSMLN